MKSREAPTGSLYDILRHFCSSTAYVEYSTTVETQKLIFIIFVNFCTVRYTVFMESFSDILRGRFGEDEPFFLFEIAAEFPNTPRISLFNKINSALSEGSIDRFGRGVYYIPRNSILGKVPLLPFKVIKKKYLSSQDEVFGYVSGLNLVNEAGVSPQVPATLEITTNNASKRIRQIEPFGGWRKITLRTPRTKVTKENVDALRLLDLITYVPLEALSDLELENLSRLSSSVDKQILMKCARYYPAKTSKQLLSHGEVRFGNNQSR